MCGDMRRHCLYWTDMVTSQPSEGKVRDCDNMIWDMGQGESGEGEIGVSK